MIIVSDHDTGNSSATKRTPTALQKGHPIYSWQSWPFVWSSGPILVKTCLQSAYESASWLRQSGAIFCVNNLWVHSTCRYLGRPGLTNIKLHWYDLNHQLHLQIDILVLVTIITDVSFFFFFGILYQLKIKTIFNSLVPRPSRNYCFNTPQNEISISVNLWVLSVSHQVNTLVLIAAHSWNNIPWEIPGCWSVLMARIHYTMHYHDSPRQIISRGDNRNGTVARCFSVFLTDHWKYTVVAG